jgi:phage shock protein PspC (stress-responsive transcriptional regulator)
MDDETRKPDPETGPTEPLTPGDPLAGGQTPPGGEAPPPGDTPPPADAPRRLTRSSSDRVIGGVAGGLGRYFGVDPVIFRIAFVVLTFTGAIGLLAYIGLLVFVPADDAVGQPRSRTASVVGAVVLGVAVVAFLGPPVFFLAPALLPLALLVLLGVLLWRAVGGGGEDADPARIAAKVALVCLLVLLAAGGFFGVFAAAALGGGVVVAVLAVVTGLVLVATAFVGGPRWLILPAVVLVLPLAIVAAADIDFDGGFGEREYRPATVSELRGGYDVGMGELIVDLRDLDLPAGRTNVNVDVGAGRALVLVPENACVSSDVQIGIGHSDVLDRDHDGVDVAYAAAASAPPGTPEVHVDADMGVGELEVRRGGDAGFDSGRFWDDDAFDEGPESACP